MNMRRPIVIGLILLCFVLASLTVFSQIRPKDYPSASRLQSSDIFIVTQNPGATNEATRKATWELVSGSISNGLTFYVSKEGSDETARLGRPDKAWLTVTGAIAYAAAAGLTGSNALLSVGPGRWTHGGASIVLPPNMNLRGAGRGLTVLSGLVSNNSDRAFFVPGDNSIVANVTIQNTNELALCTPIGPLSSQPPATNVLFSDIEIHGSTDCLLIANAGVVDMTFQTCDLHSTWDVIVLNGNANSKVRFVNCRLEASYSLPSLNGGDIRVISGSAGTVQIYGGALVALNGAGETIAIAARYGINVEAYGTTLHAASTNGLVCAVTNTLGSVTLVGCATTNTIDVSAAGILSAGNSAIGFQRTPWRLVSGFRTNNATDLAALYAIGTVGATNWLPDAGWRSNHSVTITTNPVVGQTVTINGAVGTWTNAHNDYTKWIEIAATPTDSADALSIFAQLVCPFDYNLNGPTLNLSTPRNTPSFVRIEANWGSVANGVASVGGPESDGRTLHLARDSGAGLLVILPRRDQTIDGAASLILEKPWQSVTLTLAGTNWLSDNPAPFRWLTFPTNTFNTPPPLALGSFAFWNSNGLMLWKCWNTNGTTVCRPTLP